MPHAPQTVTETARDIPVLGTWDVLVAGSGPAGCAAALAASRGGARTLLVERDGFLGGAPAGQLVTSILTTNAMDCQGIWHEFMREAKRRGGATGLVPHPKPLADYLLAGSLDPETVKATWDALMDQAGVDVLHNALACGAAVANGLLEAVFAETVAGRHAILARRVIDCTGDGAVCAAAGVPWEQGRAGEPYGMACNLACRLARVRRRERPLEEDRLPAIAAALDAARRETGYDDADITAELLARIGNRKRGRRGEPFDQLSGPGTFLFEVNPLNPWDVTRAERQGRRFHWRTAELLRRCVPDQADGHVAFSAPHLAVRSSRRIRGRYTVTEDDVWAFRKYPDDGIARGSWDIDIYDPHGYDGCSVPRHTPEYQARIERMKRGDYYDIRYGAILAEGVENLLVAGRCLSAEHVAQASLRIQQTCMATGQAAGTAAAMSLDRGAAPGDLEVSALLARLAADRAAVEPAFEEIARLDYWRP